MMKWANASIFSIESTPKNRKMKNATKTPRRQNAPNPDNKCFDFGEI
jgi:hypothetical protein